MKHKYIDMYHCEKCWDVAVKKMANAGSSPNYTLVSSGQYLFCAKYGIAEGLLRWRRQKISE